MSGITRNAILSLYFVFYVISLRNHETGKFTTSRSVAALLRNSFVHETKEEESKPIGGTFMQIKKEKNGKVKILYTDLLYL